MELSPSGLYSLEELVSAGPRIRDHQNWITDTTFFPNNGWITNSSTFDSLLSFDPQNPDFITSSNNSSSSLLTLPQQPTTFACPDDFQIIPAAAAFANIDDYAASFAEACRHDSNGGVFGQVSVDDHQFSGSYEPKMEQGISSVFINNNNNNNNNNCGEKKKSKSKKVEGQPSKNLMAERRRRKRLNDRLSMLRSIVPKISKMDRTSILGDTIDYMKELLDKIHKLRENNIDEQEDDDKSHMKSLTPNTRELKSNEAIVRNPPKFDVERRNLDTRIEICCATKPGLLLSTVNTLEALGLDIHQCVISCFNDFSLRATCYEETEHRRVLSQEEVKQALFKTAGYGGRCL